MRLKKICDKAADTYPSTTKHVLDQCKIQEMYDKSCDKASH